VAPCGSFHA